MVGIVEGGAHDALSRKHPRLLIEEGGAEDG